MSFFIFLFCFLGGQQAGARVSKMATRLYNQNGAAGVTKIDDTEGEYEVNPTARGQFLLASYNHRASLVSIMP